MAGLRDRAGIFEGDAGEALAIVEYQVNRNSDRLADVQTAMCAAMKRVIAKYTARERKRRTDGKSGR